MIRKWTHYLYPKDQFDADYRLYQLQTSIRSGCKSDTLSVACLLPKDDDWTNFLPRNLTLDDSPWIRNARDSTQTRRSTTTTTTTYDKNVFFFFSLANQSVIPSQLRIVVGNQTSKRVASQLVEAPYGCHIRTSSVAWDVVVQGRRVGSKKWRPLKKLLSDLFHKRRRFRNGNERIKKKSWSCRKPENFCVFHLFSNEIILGKIIDLKVCKMYSF